MNELQLIALVGINKHPDVPTVESHPAAGLTNANDDLTPESQLLLQLGRIAIYDRAGFRPAQVSPLQPAKDVIHVNWSERLESLLRDTIGTDQIDMLPEFLNVLNQSRLPLPNSILPELLNISDEGLRSDFRHILGERAKWLSQFNPAWSWACQDTEQPENVDRMSLEIWEEGTIPQRSEALQTIRARDPARGRQLLSMVFPKEKAADRQRLLQQLQTGLSDADESFLEEALADRSKLVRETAANLLSQLSTSEISARHTQRGLELLRVGKTSQHLHFSCHPPQDLPADWEADGIPRQVSGRSGNRSLWIEELVSRIPPNFWIEHFSATPVELLNGILSDDYAHAVISGWTRSVITKAISDKSRDEWLPALWKYWSAMIQHPQQGVKDLSTEMLTQLVTLLSPSSAEHSISQLIQSIPDPTSLPITELLRQLPTPWSVSFSREYLRITRSLTGSRSDQAVLHWLDSLSAAAIGIPPDCFEAAITPWHLRDHGFPSWQTPGMARLVDQFTERIQLRMRFYREVSLQIELQSSDAQFHSDQN